MRQLPSFLFYALLCAASVGHAAGLPDTGQSTCYNDSAADGVPAANPASIARDAGTHPRQDCRYGQDPAAAAGQLTKAGAGAKGFDYVKVANNGIALDASATLGAGSSSWACTADSNTGLTWEIKSPISTELRYSGHVYTWYSTDAATNGGNAGSTGSNTCNGTLPGNLCNTQAYVAAINAVALCSHNDWRLPTLRELLTLVDLDGSNPTIDPTYFPNTTTGGYLSATSSVPVPSTALDVIFSSGLFGIVAKTNLNAVRLVRGAQF